MAQPDDGPDPASLVFTAMQHALAAVVITDTAGRIVYVNPAFERCTGYSAAEAIGQSPSLLSSGAHPRAFYRQMWSALEAGRAWKGEVINRRKSGELYDADLAIAPVRDATGRVTHYLGTHREITADKEARRTLERKLRELDLVNHELDAFVARVSHDLREPLRDIEAATTLEHVKERAHVLQERIRGLAQLAHVGQDRRVFTPLELDEVMSDVKRDLARVIDERCARIDVAKLPGVLGNRLLVGELFTSLVEQALEHAGAVPAVRIEPDSGADTPPGFVHVVVADNGRPVPPKDRDRVFAPYFRGRGARDGAGIALALVRKVAERHGGRAWVDGGPAGGNRWHVLLPAADSARGRRSGLSPADFQARPAPAAAATPGEAFAVLLVEPDPVAAELVTHALRDCAGGPPVIHYVTGAADAQALLASAVPDVALIAPELSDGDGLALLTALRHDHPALPVVMVAGDGDERLAVLAMQRGAEDYVTHEEVPALLARAIGAVVERHRSARALEEMKTDAIGIVTHDLRNPVSNVLGYIDLLLDERGAAASDHRRILLRVRDNALFMLELIGDILDTTRLDAGKLKLLPARHDLGVLVEEALDRNAFLSRDKEIRLDPRLPGVPLPVMMDRGKILQALNNLISNAIKFSQPGTTVTVTVQATDDTVEVRVTDQGQGIPLDEIPRLFKKFSRTSARATRGEKSTGLGLYIVSQVIALHRGTIAVESEPGKGSTFRFTLPRGVSPARG